MMRLYSTLISILITCLIRPFFCNCCGGGCICGFGCGCCCGVVAVVFVVVTTIVVHLTFLIVARFILCEESGRFPTEISVLHV